MAAGDPQGVALSRELRERREQMIAALDEAVDIFCPYLEQGPSALTRERVAAINEGHFEARMNDLLITLQKVSQYVNERRES